MEGFINEPIDNENIDDDIRKDLDAGMAIAELKKRYLISNQEIKKIINRK